MLGVFAYDVHNHVTLSFALKWFFGFAAAFTGVCYLIIYTWPGKIAVPRTFPYNGLEKELGGALPHEAVLPYSHQTLMSRHERILRKKQRSKLN